MSRIQDARRKRLLAAMEPGSVAIFGTAPEARRSNDTEFPFRPDSDFWYLTGFEEPEALAVIVKGAKKPYTLFVRPRDKERETWTGRRAGPEGATKEFGADEAFPIAEIDAKLPLLLADATAVYHFFGRYPELDARLSRWMAGVRARPREVLPPRRILDPGPLLHEMRLVKAAEDLALLKEAVSISAEAHREAMAATRPGLREYEIQAVVEYVFKRRGAWAPGYNTIVGGGANATILHYVTNRDRLESGDFVLLDAGAEVECFTGDITRTWPVDGKFTKAQRAFYDVVLGVQESIIEATKTGATILELHERTVRALTEGMVSLGLLTGSVDGLIEKGDYKRFYMHRTSHWLGMDVHDVGDYLQAKGRQRALAPGMVITVEPGLYVGVDEKLPAKAEAYRGMGVRIEDDVLVTAKGHEVLSREAPKRPADVEAEMKRSSIFAPAARGERRATRVAPRAAPRRGGPKAT